MGSFLYMMRFSNLTLESDYDNDEGVDDDEDAEDEEDEKEDEEKLGVKATATKLFSSRTASTSRTLGFQTEWKEKLMSFITGRFPQKHFGLFFLRETELSFDETR